MQPTGMSVERCIAALSVLDRELCRLESHSTMNGNGHRQRGTRLPSDDPVLDLIRDLTLDVDLRRDTSSQSPMSDIESSLYLPLIEKVLVLLKQLGPTTAEAEVMGKARGLTQGALKSAAGRRN